jgi:transcriptional regulator with XRE-family HTH domain
MYYRIRDLREDKDLTQAQLSKLLGIHQTTYSDYELGNLNIPIPIISKLANLFETSVDYLVNLTDEKTPYPRAGKEGRKGGLP